MGQGQPDGYGIVAQIGESGGSGLIGSPIVEFEKGGMGGACRYGLECTPMAVCLARMTSSGTAEECALVVFLLTFSYS